MALHVIAARPIPARRFPAGLLPYRPKRARPYLYSEEEIRSLLRAALECPIAATRKAAAVDLHCLFGLLSVTGLRLGEARNLELQDVDLSGGADDPRRQVRQVSPGTLARLDLRVLADYLARRKRHWAGRPVSSYLFVSNWGNRLDGGEIHRTFYALSRQIGLRGPRTVTAHVSMICATDSRRRPSCAGTGPVRIPSAACPSCPPTSAMSTSPIRSGI